MKFLKVVDEPLCAMSKVYMYIVHLYTDAVASSVM